MRVLRRWMRIQGRALKESPGRTRMFIVVVPSARKTFCNVVCVAVIVAPVYNSSGKERKEEKGKAKHGRDRLGGKEKITGSKGRISGYALNIGYPYHMEDR